MVTKTCAPAGSGIFRLVFAELSKLSVLVMAATAIPLSTVAKARRARRTRWGRRMGVQVSKRGGGVPDQIRGSNSREAGTRQRRWQLNPVTGGGQDRPSPPASGRASGA